MLCDCLYSLTADKSTLNNHIDFFSNIETLKSFRVINALFANRERRVHDWRCFFKNGPIPASF